MIDELASSVVTLTHTGFPMGQPIPRREWEPILDPRCSADEIRQRISGLADFGPVENELARLERAGIWAVTWFSESYPKNLYRKLGNKAPPVLFGKGSVQACASAGVGIVGSRQAEESVLAAVRMFAEDAVQRRYAVVSGGAKGVDLAALSAAGKLGGTAIAIAADALALVHRKLIDGGCEPSDTTVLTPYHPESGFSVGQAMGRNKLIYAASEVALVARCDEGSGGTWTGAVEALKAGWTPVGVWMGEEGFSGNRSLAKLGAVGIRTVEGLFALIGTGSRQPSLDI